MKYEISSRPSYSFVEVGLDAGEQIAADSGAMAWMMGDIQTKTSTRGGILTGLKRKFLTGESFFQNTYTAGARGGTVAFAPGCAGDLSPYELSGGELFLQKGAYLASTTGVHCDSKWDGLRGFFNEGLFILRCTGTGTLFFNSYGDIQEIDVDGEYMVDNGFAVAWEPGLQWRLGRARKIRSFLFSDQILLRFSGQGKFWVQSRSPQSLANFCHPFRRVQRRNQN
jgi:uncharacterized protein (TIGR00266 family)